MTIKNTFMKFRGEDGDKYVSIFDILIVGPPIDEHGEELDHISDDLYQWRDIGRGFQYVIIP